LEVRQGDLASDARQLRAPSCNEVAEALAVVAAIALRGADEPPAPASAEAPVVPTPAPPSAAAEATAAPPLPAPAARTRLRPIALWGNEQVPVTAGPLEVNRTLALTLSGGVILGAIPGVVLPRYDLMFTRTNFITTPEGSSFLIGSVLNVGWSYFGNVTRESAGYATKISGFKGGVNVCTALTYDTNGFVALACAGFTVGLLSLETKHAESGYHQNAKSGLGAAAVSLDTRYNFGEHFHLSAMGGGEFWLTEIAAKRADGNELFRPRLFNASLQLGLGVHF
jgi:hypothetical protein